ncbi:MAG: glycosyltransferase family 4 protein, partial [Planctomycetota bacterium]|nr:glycosyltransferase family 4 protein [Planctomycetota bacterium]
VVVTAANGYEDPGVRYPARETLGGVRVRRLAASSFGKATLAHRLLGGALFVVQALAYGLFVRGPTVVLVSTSPPFAGFAGAILAWLRGLPAVWWVMDLNPDQIVAAGRLAPGSWPVRTFAWMNRFTLRHCGRVIALDRFMQRRLAAKAEGDGCTHVIPPWSAARPACWRPPRPNAFRDANGLERKFVVMYAGNHAPQHPLDTLLNAAARLEHDRDVAFVFIGGGAGKAAIEARIRAGAVNLVSLPFQPAAILDEMLAAADVHVVSMGNNVVGIVHPCKIYGALAVGRPVLFLGPVASPPGELLATINAGRCVEHGDVADAVAALVHLRSLSPQTRATMGQAAARAIATRFGACELCRDVCDVIEMTRRDTEISTGQSPDRRSAGSCVEKRSRSANWSGIQHGRQRRRR